MIYSITNINDKNIKNIFKDLGFIVLKNVILPETIKQILTEANQLIDNSLINDPNFYLEDSVVVPHQKLLRRVEKISDYCSVNKITYSDLIRDFLNYLMDEDYILFKDKLNLKLPGGSGFRPHVDGHYYWVDHNYIRKKGWLEYGNNFINVVIPLEDSTIHNGCLEICPQKYTKKYLGDSWEEITNNLGVKNGLFIKENDLQKFPMINIEMLPGDIAFFSWLNVHGSKNNLSNQSRKIIYATYSPKSCGDNRDLHVYDKIHSKQTLEEKMVIK